jgi:CubicO group peptidase (beta-lactamase class C family)
MEIHGHCDEKFASVREEFEKNFTERGDIGASFALTVEGEYVVDIWAGAKDETGTLAWQEDTIVNVYSTTKTMTFLVALMLADRGQLDLNAPVASYWPEFAQQGKENIPVRFLLSHSAGLPGFSRPLNPDELYDWDFVTAELAAQTPWWEPGTASGYHAITQGFLIGEVVRRITGQTIGQYFKENVADVVNADFHIGVDPKDFDRIASLVPAPASAPPMEIDPESMMAKVFGSTILPPGVTDTAGWRQAEIPAANGHGNARSVVKAQTAMANGGKAFGKELLSEAGAKRALEEQITGVDKVLMMPSRFAMGYSYSTDLIKMGPNPNTLWWGGAGGSTIIIDSDAHLCFSYVMNQMKNAIVGDERGAKPMQAIYKSLGIN